MIDGSTWRLQLTRDGDDDVGPDSAWRLAEEEPTLVGALTVEGAGTGDSWEARVALSSHPDSRCRLTVEDRDWRGTSVAWVCTEDGTLERWGRDHAVDVPDLSPEDGTVVIGMWSGLPPATMPPAWPQRPLTDLVGMTLATWTSGHSHRPREVLFAVASAPDRYDHALRITAPAGIDDQTPDDIVPGTWNRASVAESEGPVRDAEISAERVLLRGDDWLVDLRGTDLTVTLERLA